MSFSWNVSLYFDEVMDIAEGVVIEEPDANDCFFT